MKVLKCAANLAQSLKKQNLTSDVVSQIQRNAKHYIGEDFLDTLTKQVQTGSPSKLEKVGDVLVPKSDNLLIKIKEGVQDLLEMPMDFVNGGIRRVKGGKGIPFYDAHIQTERELKALQGLYDQGATIISKKPKEPKDGFPGRFRDALNATMDPQSARYDTKKERLMARFASGFTAAVFLGKDFYNKAKLKGKSDEEAKQSQLQKQGQEVRENVIEGLLQFATLSLLTKAVNQKLWLSAVIGAGIGLVSRIVSRKTSNMPICRVKVPENSINEFKNSIKENRAYETQSEQDKKAKKPVLTLKTIGGICAGAVALGYACNFGKNLVFSDNKFIKKILKGKSAKEILTNLLKKDTKVITATKDELSQLSRILKDNGEESVSAAISKLVSEEPKDVIKIATDYKAIKLGKIQIYTKDLKAIPLLPFKIVKEVASYPYKLFSRFVDAFQSKAKTKVQAKDVVPNKRKHKTNPKLETNLATFKKLLLSKSKKLEVVSDDHNIKNIYYRFCEFKKRYGDDAQKFEQEFGKYIKDARLDSLNNKTVSKVDNSKIAVLASTISTLTGMWFNMNDEFNSSIKNGETKHEAQVAARKRGLNKFARMTSQVAISGTLNNLFKQGYSSSILGSSIIVMVSTIITDYVSRLMTAMPTRKMATKQDIERFQKEHKEGNMAWYYKLVDKLAS